MKIRMLTSLAGEDVVYRYGEEVDLPDEVATAQIEAGNAEAVESLQKREEAKPDEKPKKK